MKLFEILSMYNILGAIPFKGNDSYLNNDLKRKIISNKIKYGKFKTEFDNNVSEFTKTYITEDMLKKLLEDLEFVKLVNSEILKYQQELLNEDKDIEALTLTEDEYNSIVDVMFEDVTLNEATIPVLNFLEMVYGIFVK